MFSVAHLEFGILKARPEGAHQDWRSSCPGIEKLLCFKYYTYKIPPLGPTTIISIIEGPTQRLEMLLLWDLGPAFCSGF